MIDRPARDTLAEALRHLASGKLSNDEFEDSMFNLRNNDDKALWALFDAGWCLYSDYQEYRLIGKHKLQKEGLEVVARYIIFLHADYEYEWPIKGISIMNEPLWLLPLSLITFGYASRLWYSKKILPKIQDFGDKEVWPFRYKKDFEKAKKTVRLLSGKTSTSENSK